MVFWNREKENLKEEKYAKVFWLILIIIVISAIIYSMGPYDLGPPLAKN